VISQLAANYPLLRTSNNGITCTYLVLQLLVADPSDFCPRCRQFLPKTKESFATIQNGGAAQFFHDIIPVPVFIENHAKKPMPHAPGRGAHILHRVTAVEPRETQSRPSAREAGSAVR